jgi:neutral trehalase
MELGCCRVESNIILRNRMPKNFCLLENSKKQYLQRAIIDTDLDDIIFANDRSMRESGHDNFTNRLIDKCANLNSM